MNRRKFMTLLGGAVASWPLVAQSQHAAVPVVAFIHGATSADGPLRAVPFRKGLSQAGYIEGQNVVVEYHWLEGHYETLPALLADLVQRGVAVIATPGNNQAALAAKKATATIPIVFGVGEDPVRMGLVESLARPGGNATGINFFAHETNAKRLDLMHELLPKATRYAVLLNPANASAAEATKEEIEKAAPRLGLENHFFNASTPSEIEAAFSAFSRERFDALFLAGDGFFASRSVQFATLTARDRMPASAMGREMVEAGLLMAYGTDVMDMFRQVGVYTGSILNGAKPAELPVLQSTKFELVINLQTARSLGIEIPATLLARADEVIE